MIPCYFFDMRNAFASYAGFYLWDNMPCKVEVAENGEINAMMYLEGEGFIPAPLLDIAWHGESISEARFKQEIVLLVAEARRQKASS